MREGPPHPLSETETFMDRPQTMFGSCFHHHCLVSQVLHDVHRRRLVLNSYMPTSAIARLRRWFLSIPETCKSSSTMTAGRSLSGLVLATIAEVADVAGHLCARWQYERASIGTGRTVLIPRSTPMTSPVACVGSACCSGTQMETYHLPAFSLIVALPTWRSWGGSGVL